MNDISSPSASRHLGLQGIKQYVEGGTPGTVQVEGSPTGYLLIEPGRNRLAVQLPAEGQLPDCTRYENVEVKRVWRNGSHWNELGIVTGDRLEDMYPMLCQVLDRVQLDGRSFGEAVNDILRVYRHVLAPRQRLTESEELGLFGELLVLEHLVHAIGAPDALRAWLGPSEEEHDFAFSTFDLEIKTTQAERRRHWISSATQLSPTVGKQLFLVSIQVTGGGESGQRLPTLAQSLVDLVGADAPTFAAALDRTGFSLDDADLYQKRWILRSEPAAYLVATPFPAIDLRTLQAVVPDSSHVIDLKYQLDLEGLATATVGVLDGFTVSSGGTP